MNFTINPYLIGALLLLGVGNFWYWMEWRRLLGVRKELNDLYYRRASRVQRALTPPALEVPCPIEESHSFSSWVKLNPDGTITVSGQTLDPTKEKFDVMARDENRITRASVASNGQGVLIISSHGRRYCARFESNHWNVQIIPDSKTLSDPT